MNKFKPFDRILVRAGSSSIWTADFYDHPDNIYPEHWTISGALVTNTNILPYNDETKHLHNIVSEFTKWEPKKGEVICVRDADYVAWRIRVFSHMHDSAYVCINNSETFEYHEFKTTTWKYAKPYENPFEEKQ